MKFSVNWLGEFVALPSNVAALADLLTMAGIEIKTIEQRGAKVDHVVVAQVLASSQHPNADRLSVCEVDDGSGAKRQIVCGAKNYKVGDKVLLALPGAKLPNGLEIKKSKLRGVESEGMMCSPIELGLGEDASGLLILSPEAKIGAPMSDLFPSDTILDVEITPNRGDLLSHYGLAREIGALTNVVVAAVPGGSLPMRTAAAATSVKISSPNECPFFSARRIENVKVGPSPQWLRVKIESVGMRSINNIVDISNFVMAELGQPTHAFDADKLNGAVNVRLAAEGEKFLALDGKTYSLTANNCVVADSERAVGIGGVMGGEETGVTDSTTNILLEAAYFLPASIRRTARELGLPSDASYRFERGVDPEMILRASQRATELIQEIAGGNPAKEIMVAGALPKNPAALSLSYDKCDRVLGIKIESTKIDEILEKFGLTRTKGSEKNIESTWTIPSYRRDLKRDVDLIEEVMRAYGIENISGTQSSRFAETSQADRVHDFQTFFLRERLAGLGLFEVRTSKLIPRSAVNATTIQLRNPLSEDHVALRPSLISNLVVVLNGNIRAGADRVAVFEIGRTFLSGKEPSHLGILMWGAASGPHWRQKEKRRLDFFDLKGAIEMLGIPDLSFRRAENLEFAMAAEIFSGNEKLGLAGQILASRVDAPGAVFVAEIDVDLVLQARKTGKRFRELEKFPAITRDIAMIVPEEISHEKILRTIQEPKEALLESVRLFDLFTGTEIGPAQKSLAYSLTYRDKIRTLTNEEVTAAHAKIRERLQRELGAELRE